MWSWNRHFGSWDTYFDKEIRDIRKKKHHFKTRKFIVLVLIRSILREFFILLMEDLILHNDAYEFPKKMGRIQISYNHPASKVYKYDIKKQGRNYRPVFVFTKEGFNKVKIQYYIAFTARWRKMLKQETLKGHAYELVKYEHIRIS